MKIGLLMGLYDIWVLSSVTLYILLHQFKLISGFKLPVCLFPHPKLNEGSSAGSDSSSDSAPSRPDLIISMRYFVTYSHILFPEFS
jgi:hypothetical protein